MKAKLEMSAAFLMAWAVGCGVAWLWGDLDAVGVVVIGLMFAPLVAIVGAAVDDLVVAHDRKVQQRLLEDLDRLGYDVPERWDR